MQNNNFHEAFIGKMPISKTLRNELIPVGKTMENIVNNGIVTEDELRNENYTKVKDIIDDYHRYFIEKSLINFSSDWSRFFELMRLDKSEKVEAIEEELENEKKKKRKEIINCFKEQDEFGLLFKEKLISDILPQFVSQNKDYSDKEKVENLKSLESFYRFSSYFKGFHKNRENVYADDISTSVAYRVVNENAKIFLENMEAFERINDKIVEVIDIIEKNESDILANWELKQIYIPDYYNFLLTQNSIENYNNVCGVVNSYINEYCQKNKLNRRMFTMKKLHKQILSITSSSFEIPKQFESDEELYEKVNAFISEINNQNILEDIITLFRDYESYDLGKIYIKSNKFTNVSKEIFGNWSLIKDALEYKYAQEIKGSGESKEVKVKKAIESIKYLSIQDIQELVEKYSADREIELTKSINDYFEYIVGVVAKSHFNEIKMDANINLIEEESKVAEIKSLLDEMLSVVRMIKIFDIDENVEKELSFYNEYDEIIEKISAVETLYNKVRNYVTKKPYNNEKIKLNFANPNLADGWDKNKEFDYNSMIFIRDGFYYLGILNAKNKPTREQLVGTEYHNMSTDYKKMIYKLLPDPSKMLPKVYLSKKGIETYNPGKDILEGYAKGYHKKGNDFDIDFCHKLIDYFKSCIYENPNHNVFDFKFSSTDTYEDISQFYREVAEQGYKLTFEYISEETIDTLVKNNQMYLFKIYNKDFSQGKTGKDNLHTMYLKNIFSEENLKELVIKLNGGAELFYRKRSINNPYIHKKGSVLVNKLLVDGIIIEDEMYSRISLYLNGKDVILNDKEKKLLDDGKVVYHEATHDIVKDKRYTVDKFFLHVPITINANAMARENLNDTALKYISENNEDIHVIGIDRGERNLIYVSVIDMQGRIVEQKSFNTVNNYDYHRKLDEKEKNRNDARKAWKEIGKIKELKEGYLSLVIHEITDLMLKYNAVIVMENLNGGFKNSRKKVEKSVYQKFEKMLIDKLNYLVSKDEKVDNPGGLLRGYQLTYKVDTLDKLGTQCGMLFYVPAAYTSKIDPTTGFADVFKFKEYTSGATRKNFLMKFNNISYDSDKDMFKFSFDYSQFPTYQTMSVTEWTVYTNGERIIKEWDKKNSRYLDKVVYLTEELKSVLEDAGIVYEDGHNIVADIKDLDDRKDLLVINKIFYTLKNAVQLRNSKSGDLTYDKIISPIINDSGDFYESGKDTYLPYDADANGAYHIALKGLRGVQQIKDNWVPSEKFNKKLLNVSNSDWFSYVQNKEYRNYNG